MKPLAIDLFCGLGGWSESLLAEGYDVVGFDIERHEYGEHRYPGQLVIQDVLTLHGSQFRNAALIVASPPCQFFSYTAMPWSRAKQLAREVRSDPMRLDKELALFRACFRIQREASEAAGRHVPLIVENVRGAIPWVGRSRWNFGSFHLWGDVPALMPHRFQGESNKIPAAVNEAIRQGCSPARWTNPGEHYWGAKTDGIKVPSFRFDGSGRSFQSASVEGFGWPRDSELRNNNSKSPARKAASAMIAKIPAPLARHIAITFKQEPRC